MPCRRACKRIQYELLKFLHYPAQQKNSAVQESVVNHRINKQFRYSESCSRIIHGWIHGWMSRSDLVNLELYCHDIDNN